jgi:PHD/YefM family antitoxin component YafN of YafNO toxin-antitoxin module
MNDEDKAPEVQSNNDDKAPVDQSNNDDKAPVDQSNNDDKAPVDQNNNNDKAPVVQSNNEDKAPEVQSNNDDKAPVDQSNNDDKAPVVQSNNDDKAPVVQSNNDDKAPVVQNKDSTNACNPEIKTKIKTAVLAKISQNIAQFATVLGLSENAPYLNMNALKLEDTNQMDALTALINNKVESYIETAENEDCSINSNKLNSQTATLVNLQSNIGISQLKEIISDLVGNGDIPCKDTNNYIGSQQTIFNQEYFDYYLAKNELLVSKLTEAIQILESYNPECKKEKN